MPALIFDCDGVLADTERYGHLPAFNAMFAEFGVPIEWSEEDYAELVPIALHGGSGLSDEQFHDLIARGCAKVNISTALKELFMQSSLRTLEKAKAADKWDPPSLFAAVRQDVVALAAGLMQQFGSAGRAR